jgi:gliding motility-associated-like protein
MTRICLIILFTFPFLPAIGQNCDVDFPGTAVRNFSLACGGVSSSNLRLGKNVYMGDGDIFIFDLPIININGNLSVNAQGSGKIVIPLGVTVNVSGNFHLDAQNSGCSAANPCIFEIEVNGQINFSHNFHSNIVTLVWSGTGSVVIDDHFKNLSSGCMNCGPDGCPDFEVNSSDCMDEASGCSGGNFCTYITECSSDQDKPIITNCPGNQVVNMTGPYCAQAVTWTSPTASDNCTLSSFTASKTPGSIFPKDITTVTYTATDAAGNSATCSFDVNVIDNTDPVITGCPADITINTNASCQAVVNWVAPDFTDNCSGGTMTATKAPGTTFSKGTTTVTYTATDAADNTATCSFNVNVVDNMASVITGCPMDITVNANASCKMNVSWIAPTVTLKCNTVTLSSSHHPGDVFPTGNTEVKYTATDDHGNTALCVFNVLVKNETLPVISKCPADISIKANAEGVASVYWTEPTATTQCGKVTITGSHKSGTLFNIGTNEIEYEATDDTGNSAYCSFSVVVTKTEIDVDIGKIVTPDGNAINDEWVLTNIEKFKDNTVAVFDRWGNLIFTGTGYDNEKVVWRGTNRSGALVPSGTYYYTIFVRYGSSKFETRGFIELMR